MLLNAKPGYFQFCLDLGLESDQTGLAEHRQLVDLTGQVVQLFERYQVVATWAMHQPVISRLADAVRSSGLQHELALRTDGCWAGPSVGRKAILAHLRQHVDETREHDVAVTSIVLRHDMSQHEDLLFKSGLRVVCSGLASASSRKSTGDSAFPRNGMWHTRSTAAFPAAGRLLGRFDQGYQAKRILRRSLQGKQIEQLSVSMSAIIRSSQPAVLLKSLGKVVRHAAKLQAAGNVRCETLSMARARWQPPAQRRSQQSVLRPAA